MKERLKAPHKRQLKINIVASQKRTNARMDELEEKSATVELRKIMGDNSRVKKQITLSDAVGKTNDKRAQQREH